MILFYCLLFCSLSLLRYYVMGQESGKHSEPGADQILEHNKEETNVTRKILERYIIENDFLPAIFGSYKYDPLLQNFDVAEKFKNATSATEPSHATHNNIHTSTQTHSGSRDSNQDKESTGHKFLRKGLYSTVYGEMVTNLRPKPIRAKKITIPWEGGTIAI